MIAEAHKPVSGSLNEGMMSSQENGRPVELSLRNGEYP